MCTEKRIEQTALLPHPNIRSSDSSVFIGVWYISGKSKFIFCFASQGKILYPQPGLFPFIKFTRQAIYCCSVGTEKCFNFTNRLSLSPTQTQIDSLRRSQFTIITWFRLRRRVISLSNRGWWEIEKNKQIFQLDSFLPLTSVLDLLWCTSKAYSDKNKFIKNHLYQWSSMKTYIMST